jgi:hypothetical protein
MLHTNKDTKLLVPIIWTLVRRFTHQNSSIEIHASYNLLLIPLSSHTETAAKE